MTDERASNSFPDMDRQADLDSERHPFGDIAFDPSCDPVPEPALAAALHELTAPPAPVPEWEVLRRAITGAAARHLARRRGAATWWYHAAGWAGRAIPVGLAASVALTFGLRAIAPDSPAPAPGSTTRLTLEMVLVAVFDEALETILPASGDDLLRAAILIED